MINKYQHRVSKENYEDYSSGRVLYGATGATNFPVRLSSEVFQQCASHLVSKGKMGPYKIYDPFCGVAYSLTVTGFLHGEEIDEIIASDADKRILEFAEKNLSLLSVEGLHKREEELKQFIKEYNKNSHKEALESAYRLQSKINPTKVIKRVSFQFNIIEGNDLPLSIPQIDIVIADLPYGKLTEWEGVKTEENLVERFLNKLKPHLSQISIVAVIYDKKQLISHSGYRAIKKLKLEKRKIIMLELEDDKPIK